MNEEAQELTEKSRNGKVKDVEYSEKSFICFKILKQLTLVGVWVALGLFVEVIGPTLTDLKDYVGVDYEKISRALVAKSVGFFVGSFFGGHIMTGSFVGRGNQYIQLVKVLYCKLLTIGFLHERFYKQTDLIMSIGILLGAVGIVICPLVPSLEVVASMLFLTGLSEGFINTGGNTMVLHMWGDKAASPMCSLHLGFGIGAMLAPQIAKPFLKDTDGSENNHTISDSILLNLSMSSTLPTYTELLDVTTESGNGSLASNASVPWQPANIAIPYGIVGAVTLLFSIFMFIFFLVGLPKGFPTRTGTKNFRKLINPAQCAFGSHCYGILVLGLLFVYFIQAVGGERAYGKYISAYSLVNDVKFSKKKSADLATVFWFCHMGGRLTGTIVAQWVPLFFIMVGFISGSLIGSVVLSIFGHNTEMILWIFTGLMGFTISLVFPSGMSWANLNMQINSVGVMVLTMGGACGGFIYQYIPGYLLEYVGNRTLMYVMVAYAVLLAINFVIMEFVGRKIGRPLAEDFVSDKNTKDETELEVLEKK